MILAILLFILIGGAFVAALAAQWSTTLPRYIVLLSLAIDIVLLLGFWNLSQFPVLFKNNQPWMLEYNHAWIGIFNANIHLAMDGLSYIMVLLTLAMGFFAVIMSPSNKNEGFYYFNTLLMIAGVTGIFLAVDLFLFFFFWEMMLVPLYLLMVMFSNNNDPKSSFRFLVYTQGSGLILMTSILCLVIINYRYSGILTFDLMKLKAMHLSPAIGSILFGGFLLSFLVKLPVLPFHGWLPDTFRDAPLTAVVTGLLIKTGAYGIIRFAIPLFPDVSQYYTSIMLTLGIVTIFYGAFMAFIKDDLRQIAAYSSISHMGFIVIGLFSYNQMAWQGVVVQMVASGISTSALVLMAATIEKRTGTSNINQLGRLWENVPVLSGFGVVIAMASLGLPGMANFVAEFLILGGAFKVHLFTAIVASLGLVVGAAYSLRIIQKVFVGNKNKEYTITDFNGVETITLGSLVALLLWLGLYPASVLSRTKDTVVKALETSTQIMDQPPHKNSNEASVTTGMDIK